MTGTETDALKTVSKKRGYRLSYHRMLDASDPDLLRAYDEFYTKLTLDPRVLTAAERETVWVALLVAAREEHGTIHLRRAEAAGLSHDRIADAVAIAGAVEAHDATVGFAGRHWSDWTPRDALQARYLELVDQARGAIGPALADLCAAVCHAARRGHDGMTLHIGRFFQAGGQRDALTEGLSYLLLPCGGPTLIDAVEAWASAAETGEFPGPYAE